MLDLVLLIWRDRGKTKDQKMKLGHSLVWTVLKEGAEGWTPKAEEKRIESAEFRIYHRMLQVSLTEHRTDQSILNRTRQLSAILPRVLLQSPAFPQIGCAAIWWKPIKTTLSDVKIIDRTCVLKLNFAEIVITQICMIYSTKLPTETECTRL